jgi:hypothetical protein
MCCRCWSGRSNRVAMLLVIDRKEKLNEQAVLVLHMEQENSIPRRYLHSIGYTSRSKSRYSRTHPYLSNSFSSAVCFFLQHVVPM